MNNFANIRPYGLLRTFLLSISLITASTIMGAYILKSCRIPRYVTVKGLAGRQVIANVGVWPINWRITGDDLPLLKQKFDTQRTIITTFLNKEGFTNEEIRYGMPGIDDSDSYNRDTGRNFRYVLRASITVYSNQVATLEKVLQKSEELVGKGIVIDTETMEDYKPQFFFTNLTEIRPAMIQEATLEARKAADQFAKDSGSKIGSICQATQGTFSIGNTHIPTKKHVWVVTTVQYRLIG